MTYAIGQAQSGKEVHGQFISTEQYIQVNWPWIILPLLEVVMAVALLICTLVHTQRKGVLSWKSSAIVPMMTAMEGWDDKELQATSLRDIEKRPEHMRGQMEANESDALILGVRIGSSVCEK
jgi:hypothetical protein